MSLKIISKKEKRNIKKENKINTMKFVRFINKFVRNATQELMEKEFHGEAFINAFLFFFSFKPDDKIMMLPANS